MNKTKRKEMTYLVAVVIIFFAAITLVTTLMYKNGGNLFKKELKLKKGEKI